MKRFLIARLSALGDTVCSLPAASALKRGFPDSHIAWVVDKKWAGVVECCEAVDQVIPISFSLKSLPTYDQEFDAALDLQGLAKSGLCVWRAKAKQKVGYHWRREGAWLFSQQVLPDPTSIHVVDQYVDVARAVGGQMDRAEFRMKPRDEDVQTVRSLLASHGVTGKYVVVNAGAGWETKRWVAKYFAEVIDRLSEQGIASVLTGSKGKPDVEAAEEVMCACVNQPVSLLGKTSVRELIALIDGSAAHLGGDTGSSHIAAALGRPAVSMYSITKPHRSCPYGQIDRCLYDPDALANIKPDAVFDALQGALE